MSTPAKSSIRRAIIQILKWIGENPDRSGLRETPDRMIRSYLELFSGYQQDPADLMKLFDGESYDEMVLLKNCEFTSFCEHHFLPFCGKIHIAYLPSGNRIIGLSKLARLV